MANEKSKETPEKAEKIERLPSLNAGALSYFDDMRFLDQHGEDLASIISTYRKGEDYKPAIDKFIEKEYSDPDMSPEEYKDLHAHILAKVERIIKRYGGKGKDRFVHFDEDGDYTIDYRKIYQLIGGKTNTSKYLDECIVKAEKSIIAYTKRHAPDALASVKESLASTFQTCFSPWGREDLGHIINLGDENDSPLLDRFREGPRLLYLFHLDSYYQELPTRIQEYREEAASKKEDVKKGADEFEEELK